MFRRSAASGITSKIKETAMSAAPVVSFSLIIIVGGVLLLALVGLGVGVFLAAQGSRRDDEK